jgi:hypothetical protein
MLIMQNVSNQGCSVNGLSCEIVIGQRLVIEISGFDSTFLGEGSLIPNNQGEESAKHSCWNHMLLAILLAFALCKGVS